jgi:hypothetical protein
MVTPAGYNRVAPQKAVLPMGRGWDSNNGMRTTAVFVVLAAFGMCPLGAAERKIDFGKDVLPILEQQCVKCHGEDKQKGKLRLDSREAALKGGSGGPAMVAGEASKSELYRRITLPKDDDEFMPSEGEPLSKAQLEIIREWINQGAVWPEVADKGAGARPKDEPVLPADFKPGAGETKAIAKLAEAGVEARPIAMNVPRGEFSVAGDEYHGWNDRATEGAGECGGGESCDDKGDGRGVGACEGVDEFDQVAS